MTDTTPLERVKTGNVMILEAQAKSVRFESAGASALHTPSLSVLIQVTRQVSRDRSLIRRCVMTKLSLIVPF